MISRKPFLGLLQRRSCIVLTWRGWLVLLLALGTAATLFVRNIYGFLAVEDPVRGGILVIEGWSSDNVIEGGVDDFRTHHYDRICLTGGPIEFGHALYAQKTYAEYAQTFCLKLGVPATALVGIPAPAVERDRSYASALALREWLVAHGGLAVKINLVGNGAHSRRTRLVYEKALGPATQVGISNVAEVNFDPKVWWKSSMGFRNVLDETIAYLYARLLFSPKPQT